MIPHDTGIKHRNRLAYFILQWQWPTDLPPISMLYILMDSLTLARVAVIRSKRHKGYHVHYTTVRIVYSVGKSNGIERQYIGPSAMTVTSAHHLLNHSTRSTWRRLVDPQSSLGKKMERGSLFSWNHPDCGTSWRRSSIYILEPTWGLDFSCDVTVALLWWPCWPHISERSLGPICVYEATICGFAITYSPEFTLRFSGHHP